MYIHIYIYTYIYIYINIYIYIYIYIYRWRSQWLSLWQGAEFHICKYSISEDRFTSKYKFVNTQHK